MGCCFYAIFPFALTPAQVSTIFFSSTHEWIVNVNFMVHVCRRWKRVSITERVKGALVGWQVIGARHFVLHSVEYQVRRSCSKVPNFDFVHNFTAIRSLPRKSDQFQPYMVILPSRHSRILSRGDVVHHVLAIVTLLPPGATTTTALLFFTYSNTVGNFYHVAL